MLGKVPALLPDDEGDEVRTVVLLSDDVSWLRAEMDRFHEEQQVAVLLPPSSSLLPLPPSPPSHLCDCVV